MANFFALAALAAWSQIGGWSSTSGGASNGLAAPGAGDSVIFDGNSGAGRTISIGNTNRQINNIDFSASAGGFQITATGGAFFQLAGGNLTGCTSFPKISCISGGTTAITGGGCTIDSLAISAHAASISGNLTIASNIVMDTTSSLSAIGGGTITLGGTLNTGDFTGNTVNFGSSTWVFNSNTPFTRSGDEAFTMSSATFKFAWSGAGPVDLSTLAITCSVLWNQIASSGYLLIQGCNVGTFRASPGSITRIVFGNQLIAGTWDIDGLGTLTTLTSNVGGSAALVSKSGGGTVQLNYASLQDISCATPGIFSAKNSRNVSGNSNITFITYPNNFLLFF